MAKKHQRTAENAENGGNQFLHFRLEIDRLIGSVRHLNANYLSSASFASSVVKLPVCQNKNPAEWEQNFSLIVRRIRFLKAFQAHLFEELALLVVGQAVEIRAHAGAADPVKNGLRTVH